MNHRMNYLGSLLLLLLTGMALHSCETTEEDREPQLSDYIDFKVTHCERIGSVLVVDFTARNKTKNTLRDITFDGRGFVNKHSSDNLGNTYDSEISLAGGSYGYSKTFSLQKDESCTGRFRISSFDPTNRATTFVLGFTGDIRSEELSNSAFRTGSIRIADNRVTENGFQTPDDGLEIEWTGSSYDPASGTARISFSLKNTTQNTIRDLRFNTHYGHFADNNGT